MKLHIFVVCLFLLDGNASTLKTRINSRIIGGELARAGQFPYSAAIYIITANGRYFCGGTLLTEQWILTAGQCVDGAQEFRIILGTNKLNDPDAYVVSADTYVLHPNYNSEILDNDIALIWLRLPVEFDDYRKPVDFLPFAELPTDSSVMAIGWGQTLDSEEELANDLNWVYLTTFGNTECKAAFGNQITDNVVCVGGNYNQGMCTGDGGSGLVQTISRGHSVIVGIASFTSPNGCEAADPSGYTRVFGYNDWISNITGKT